MGMTDTTWTIHCHITYRFPPVQCVHTVSLSKGLVYIFSANERKRLLLDICWAFSHDSFLFIIILWSTAEKNLSFTGVLDNFWNESWKYWQSVYILTSTELHPSWCDCQLERSHYTLDCMLSDKTIFSNQDNNSKEHN